MASKRYTFLKIPQEDDVDITYKISLDDLDLSLLPINQLLNRYNGGKECTLWDVDSNLRAMKEYSRVEDEICKFEVYAQRIVNENSEINTNRRSIFCYLCNLNIPATYMKNHIDSDKHVNFLKLSHEVLARTSKQLNEILFIEKNTETAIEKSYYCETCNIIIENNLKINHETEKTHIRLLKRDQLLGKLFEIYTEDLKENDEKVDIQVEKEMVVKSDEVPKVYNSEKIDIKNTCMQVLLDKTQTNIIQNKTSVNIESNNDLNIKCIKNDTGNKQKNIDSKTKTIQKSSVTADENKLIKDVNLKKLQNRAEDATKNKHSQMETLNKVKEEVNTDNKTNINCSSSNDRKQIFMTHEISTHNRTVNQELQKDSVKAKANIIKINEKNSAQVTVETEETVKNDPFHKTPITRNFKIDDFDDNHYRVTALSGDVIKVSKTNWHEIKVYKFENNNTECFDCMLCRKERQPITLLKSHLGYKNHKRCLLTPVENKHCSRKVTRVSCNLLNYCVLCGCFCDDGDSHKLTQKHKINLDQALIFPRDTQINSETTIKGQDQNIKTTNETNKNSNFHFCEICEVNVPNNSNNIRTHNEGRPHKKNVLNSMKASINTLTTITQTSLSNGQTKNLQNVDETNSSRIEARISAAVSKPQNGFTKCKKQEEQLADINITQKNVVSETKASKNKNIFEEVDERTSLASNKSQNKNKQLVIQKNHKEQLGDTTKQKNVDTEIKNIVMENKSITSAARTKQQDDITDYNNSVNKIKQTKQLTDCIATTSLASNKSQNKNKQLVIQKNHKEQLGDTTKQKNVDTEIKNIVMENKSITSAARTKQQDDITDYNNSVNKIKQTKQLTDCIATTQKNVPNENKRTENEEITKEIKASTSTAAQNGLDENKPLKNQQHFADNTKTQENIKSEKEQTDNDGIPKELIKNSKAIRELVYRINDVGTVQWIVNSFDCLIAVPTKSGDILKISKLNYHGLKVRQWVHCLICDTEYDMVPFSKFLYEHIESNRHINKLNINGKNGLRLGRHETVHCVLCNISMESMAVNDHLSREKHRVLEAKALLNPKETINLPVHFPNEIKIESDANYQTIGPGHCSKNNDKAISKDNRQEQSETGQGDYISKLIRKAYTDNDISSYKLLQFFWLYKVVGTVNGDMLKLRYLYFHGIHVIDETDCYSCLLCQKHNRTISLKSITDHIESQHHKRQLIQFQDVHGLRQIRAGYFHCALCNVSFRFNSISEHVCSSMHQEVVGKDPEPQFVEDTSTEPTVSPDKDTKSNETSSCVII